MDPIQNSQIDDLPWFIHDQILIYLDVSDIVTLSRMSRYWRSRSFRRLFRSTNTKALERAPKFKNSIKRISKLVKDVTLYEDMYMLDPILSLFKNMTSITLTELQGQGEGWKILLTFFSRLSGIAKLTIDCLAPQKAMEAAVCFHGVRELSIHPRLTRHQFEEVLGSPSIEQVVNLTLVTYSCTPDSLSLINRALPGLLSLDLDCHTFTYLREEIPKAFLSLEIFSLHFRPGPRFEHSLFDHKLLPAVKKLSLSDAELFQLGNHSLDSPFPDISHLHVTRISTAFVKIFSYSFKSLFSLKVDIRRLPFYSVLLLLSNIDQVSRLTISGIGSCKDTFRLPTKVYRATHVVFEEIFSYNYLAVSWVSRCFPYLQFLDMDFGVRMKQLYWPGDPALPMLSRTLFCLKVRSRNKLEDLVEICKSCPAMEFLYFNYSNYRVETIKAAFPGLKTNSL